MIGISVVTPGRAPPMTIGVVVRVQPLAAGMQRPAAGFAVVSFAPVHQRLTVYPFALAGNPLMAPRPGPDSDQVPGIVMPIWPVSVKLVSPPYTPPCLIVAPEKYPLPLPSSVVVWFWMNALNLRPRAVMWYTVGKVLAPSTELSPGTIESIVAVIVPESMSSGRNCAKPMVSA